MSTNAMVKFAEQWETESYLQRKPLRARSDSTRACTRFATGRVLMLLSARQN
jgi:hypothetical protein